MPGQDRYIALPDGKYVHVPGDATPEQLSALRVKLGGKPAPFGADALSKATGVGPRPSQGPLIDTIEKAREWIENKVTTGSQGSYVDKKGERVSGPGEFMESAPLGALRFAKGGMEMFTPGQSTWQGMKDVAGGAAQAATMPGMVLAPEGAEAAAGAIPSTARAGQKLEEVLGAARDVPINATGPVQEAFRGKEIASRGGSLPKILRDFTRRTSSPEAEPITYKEARDFYTNARLAMTEYLQTKPNMWRQVTIFKNALGEALQEAAAAAGKGAEYKSAMAEYRRAKTLQKLAAAAGALGIKMGGLGAGYSLLKSTLGGGGQ